MVVGAPRSIWSQSWELGDPRSPQIGFVPTKEPDTTGRPLMVNPSTAFAGLVACDAGVVEVNDAEAVLPAARLTPVPAASDAGVRFTPAFWKLTTIRVLPEKFTWSADSSGTVAW